MRERAQEADEQREKENKEAIAEHRRNYKKMTVLRGLAGSLLSAGEQLL